MHVRARKIKNNNDNDKKSGTDSENNAYEFYRSEITLSKTCVPDAPTRDIVRWTSHRLTDHYRTRWQEFCVAMRSSVKCRHRFRNVLLFGKCRCDNERLSNKSPEDYSEQQQSSARIQPEFHDNGNVPLQSYFGFKIE
jgi:hypothetical protein